MNVPESMPQGGGQSQRNPKRMMSVAHSVLIHQARSLGLRTFQYLATDVTKGRCCPSLLLLLSMRGFGISQ